MQIDSKKQKLDTGQIIGIFLQNNKQPHSPEVMMPAILDELSQPNTEVKQFGNTLFEVHKGKDGQGFFKAFNADTGANFVENSKVFAVWAKRVLGLKILVTEYSDESLDRLFKLIAFNPPMPGMGYQVFRAKDGKTTRVALNLGA
jgi:hypothetical protein